MHYTVKAPSKRHWPRVRVMAGVGALGLNWATALAAGPYAYLPSNFDNTFSVVDLSNTLATPPTYTVTGTEDITAFYGVALSAKDGMVYVSDQDNETVFQLNAATGGTVRSFFVGSNPRGIAVDPSGKHVYVADFASSEMSIIDTGTHAVTGVDFSNLSGTAFASPSGLALNLAGTRAYVTDASVNQRLCRVNLVSPPDSVADGDCVEVGANVDDGADPNAVAVSPDESRVYVVNTGEATVSVVDTASFTVTRTFSLGYASPNGIAISSSGKRGYVGTGLGKIIVLDLTKVANVSMDPVMTVIDDDAIEAVQGVAISTDGTRLLAADQSTGQLHFINIVGDANVRATSVTVNEGPVAMGQFTAPDPVFVGNFDG